MPRPRLGPSGRETEEGARGAENPKQEGQGGDPPGWARFRGPLCVWDSFLPGASGRPGSPGVFPSVYENEKNPQGDPCGISTTEMTTRSSTVASETQLSLLILFFKKKKKLVNKSQPSQLQGSPRGGYVSSLSTHQEISLRVW